MAVAIGLGLFEFPFSGARAFWRWIDVCESGGIDSFWQSDRISTDEPMLECMSAMAALSGATRRLKFGMFVASAGLRDPLLLAKQCATIDVLSDGRLLPAFGVGNPRSGDWAATCTQPQGAGRRADEALDIIAALWRGESVSCDGEFHRYCEATVSPLPVQKRLPLWIGGSSQVAARRTARIGTGWIGGLDTPAQAAHMVRSIKQACEVTGRRVANDHYGAGFSYRFGADDEPVVRHEVAQLARTAPDRVPESSMVVGGRAEIVSRLREYVEGGVTKFVLRPIGADDDDLLRQTRYLIEQVLPDLPDLDVIASSDDA